MVYQVPPCQLFDQIFRHFTCEYKLIPQIENICFQTKLEHRFPHMVLILNNNCNRLFKVNIPAHTGGPKCKSFQEVDIDAEREIKFRNNLTVKFTGIGVGDRLIDNFTVWDGDQGVIRRNDPYGPESTDGQKESLRRRKYF